VNLTQGKRLVIGDSERAGEFVQVTIGQFAMQSALQILESRDTQQFGSGWQSLADLQIGLPIQIGRFDVTQRMRLTIIKERHNGFSINSMERKIKKKKNVPRRNQDKIGREESSSSDSNHISNVNLLPCQP
jgi:hypothetical protein